MTALVKLFAGTPSGPDANGVPAANSVSKDEPMGKFNDFVRNDPRVECVLLTVRDGILVIRKR